MRKRRREDAAARDSPVYDDDDDDDDDDDVFHPDLVEAVCGAEYVIDKIVDSRPVCLNGEDTIEVLTAPPPKPIACTLKQKRPCLLSTTLRLDVRVRQETSATFCCTRLVAFFLVHAALWFLLLVLTQMLF